LVKVTVEFRILRTAVMRLVAEADARPNRLTETCVGVDQGHERWFREVCWTLIHPLQAALECAKAGPMPSQRFVRVERPTETRPQRIDPVE
jgi:hypothetical protein